MTRLWDVMQVHIPIKQEKNVDDVFEYTCQTSGWFSCSIKVLSFHFSFSDLTFPWSGILFWIIGEIIYVHTGDMDPYVLIQYKGQEHRSSVSKG